jgi:hypothetical protein
MSGIQKKFDRAMLGIYQTAKADLNYNATTYLRMLHEKGGLATARYLINSKLPSDGYTKLFENDRLDLTVEAMVVQNEEWHELFTEDELKKARDRLRSYGYKI